MYLEVGQSPRMYQQVVVVSGIGNVKTGALYKSRQNYSNWIFRVNSF